MRYTDEVINLQKNEMEKDFWNYKKLTKATGTSKKVAGEWDTLQQIDV